MKSTRILFAGVSASALMLLAACNTTNAKLQTDGDAYIRANISELSTISPSLGGTFGVTAIEWIDDDTAIVTYEDGHMQFKGRADVSVGSDGSILVTRIRLEPGEGNNSSSQSSDAMNTVSSSVSSAASARARAKLGEFCGGIAGFQCEDGLTCQYEGTYPDAGGTCVR